jgi:hypothetical protein
MRFLLLIVLCCSADASYWVSKSGNNGNNGSQASPWLTLAYANTNAAGGSLIHVVGPGLWAESLAINAARSGTATNYTTWKWEGGAQVHEIHLTGASYVKIIGAEVTNSDSAIHQTGITLESSTNCQVLDCWVHDVYGAGITSLDHAPSLGLVIRSNIVTRTGQYSGTQHDGAAGIYIYGHLCLVEYNNVSRVSDFTGVCGQSNIIRNNYFHDVQPAYYDASDPHVDLIEMQPENADMDIIANVFERNLSEDNSMPNSHGSLIRNVNATRTNTGTIYRMNSINRLGSYGLIVGDSNDTSDSTRIKIYNNTFAYANTSNEAQDACIGVDSVTTNAVGIRSLNNIFLSCNVQSRIYFLSGPTDFAPDYDMVMSNTFGLQQAHGTTNNPLVVNTNNDMRLQAGSPAILAATHQTFAVGSSNGSTLLRVNDPFMFTSGNGIADGDWITIGEGGLVQVTAINYAASNLTLSAAQTWLNNDAVQLNGTRDTGAFPYKSDWTIAATLTSAGNNYTVSADAALVRQVVFYEDGIPQPPKFNPFTYTSSGGTVTAKAFPLYASQTLAYDATPGGGPTLTITGTLRAGNVRSQ